MLKMFKNCKKGFTLLELLVVVLIIGILASIALPQYQMAVTKAKVASMLPLMRRWKDAMYEYKLQHGDYEFEDASDLGVSWPSDWKNNVGDPCGDNLNCYNDYWYCIPNSETGLIRCFHDMDDGSTHSLVIYQPDDPDFENLRGLVTCECDEEQESEKVCKALGGKLLDNVVGYMGVAYKLN